ncbi:NifU family protein [Oscillospiraceae bacterium PP1C4]
MQNRIEKKIEDVLNEKVRPSLHKHHGDVAVLSFEEGILKIRLLGQCSDCPSSYLTTEQLIEKELIEAIPEVNRVVLVTQVSDQLLDMARSMLRH